MGQVRFVSRTGADAVVDEETVKAFCAGVRGSTFSPGDDGYDEARSIWNAMIDKRPALIVRCSGTADVIAAVNFAREHAVLVSVRGGGHNIAGTALCDDGLTIDLSALKGIHVDLEKRTVRAQPGCNLGDLDRESQAFGLAVPAGIVTDTGIAGLTIGGGFGWLTRKYGYTCDNLLSADVVTADGSFLTASDNENTDLFWGLRGGGGNFGIVTSFEYQAYPIGPQITAEWGSSAPSPPDRLPLSLPGSADPPTRAKPRKGRGLALPGSEPIHDALVCRGSCCKKSATT